MNTGQIYFHMKKTVLLLSLFISSLTVFAQGQFIIGLKGGISGAFYQFNSGAFSNPANPYNGSGYTKISSTGPSIPALLELIYSTKKFRVGYQFEYERILTSSYKVKIYNQTASYSDSTVYDASITQHFFCHNLLLEYIAFDNRKNLRLAPQLTFGYFHGISGTTTMAPYDFSSLNQNRFKIGVALNLEYYFGPYSVVVTPSYGLVPVKALADPNQKGYLHILGLHVGMRFNVTKSKQDAEHNPKKKKKEYVNPEEDN